MKLKNLIISMSLIGLFVTIPTNIALANNNDDGYDSSLSKVGISQEMYKNMPADKQELYNNIVIDNVESVTKYYRCSEPIDKTLKAIDDNSDSVNTMEEISEEQFILETSTISDEQFIQALSDTDTTETSWVKMTTTIGSSSSDEWVLSNDVTYIKSNGFMQPKNTHVIGLGGNANFSVVKGSEYLKREFDISAPDLGVYTPGQTEYFWSAYEKSTGGYGFVFDIVETEISNKAFMALRITPNVSDTKLADGFGHYAKYSNCVKPSLSFSSGGASLSISPDKKKSVAPNTHVQLKK